MIAADFGVGLVVGLVIGVLGTLATMGAKLSRVEQAVLDLTRRVGILEPTPGAHFHRRHTDTDDE